MNTGTRKSKKNSVFADIAKPNDNLASFKEAIVSEAKAKGEKAPNKEEKKEFTYVYEVSFTKEASSYLLFSNSIDLDDDSLALFGVFTRYLLQEVINPNENIIVKETGRKEMLEKDFTIPFIYGVTIKKILKEPWMDRSEEDTKKVFDEKVLQAYRDYKNSLLKIYHSTINNQNNFVDDEDENQNYQQNQKDQRYEGINRKEIKGL